MAQGETKNIGQVAAIWIGAVAPTNVKLIWYDTSNNVHRVYNTSTGQWEVLNPQAVTNISLDSLVTVATTSGLPIGKFYYLIDVGSLAISITTTKVWYADTHNNYVINDLAGAIQHYLNSDNLTIDGKTGVWDSNTGKLTFSFNDILYPGQLDKEQDSVLLHHGTGSFLKAKLKHLISTATGNSITWTNGLFFSASSFISSIRNVAGGIVGFDRYQMDMSSVTTALSNLATDNNTVRNDCKSYTDGKTTDAQIFNKKLGVGISVSPSPANTPAVGWNFYQILADIYGWFSRLRYGNNVYISTNFNANGQSGEINQSDTVATAFQKTVYKLKRLAISDNVSLPSDFDGTDAETYTDYPVANNNLTQAIGKLTVKMRELFPRPYVNESEWHTEDDMKWIIRNNNLFISVNRLVYGPSGSGNIYVRVADYQSFSDRILEIRASSSVQRLKFGEAFAQYAECFDKIPISYTYEYGDSFTVTRYQKFIPLFNYTGQQQLGKLIPLSTEGDTPLEVRNRLYGEIGLCLEYEAGGVWSENIVFVRAFIGFCTHSELQSTESDVTLPIDYIPAQTVAVPLSF